jgi:hypothetical protein
MKWNERKYTVQEVSRRWADILVINSNVLGQINSTCFSPGDFLPDDDPSFIFREAILKDREFKDQLEYVSYLTGYLTSVYAHLYNNGYIKEKSLTTPVWQLTEKGKLMKELGGHKHYVKHRKREINVIENQSLINKLLILATASAALVPLGIEIYNRTHPILNAPQQVKVTVKPQLEPVVVNIDTVLFVSPHIKRKPNQK